MHIIEHSPLPPSLILDHDRQWIAESRRNIAQKLKEGWIKMAKEKINPRLEKENIKFNIIVSTDELPISEQILKFATENDVQILLLLVVTDSVKFQRLKHWVVFQEKLQKT